MVVVAQSDNPWQWQPDSRIGAQDRMVVFADLMVDGVSVPLSEVEQRYVVGAFIDGTCRGVAEVIDGSAPWMQIEVYGNYGSINDEGKPVSFLLYDKEYDVELTLYSSRSVTWGQDSYGTPSSDHVVLSTIANYDNAIITFPATVTLSRLHDVALTLTHTNAGQTAVAPGKVSIVIADGPHGWTAASATGKGLEWTLRGMAVGEYDYYVTYDGKPMFSDQGTDKGKLIIPAEVALENGWDWISIFMPQSFALTSGNGSFLPLLNNIIEIRSQKGSLYNDPQKGFFGDITQLSLAEGAYKVKCGQTSDNGGALVFNLGTAVDGAATMALVPMMKPGYNWIAYPHEQNHTLATLNEFLSANASEGDLLIGHDAFLEFNGLHWIGSVDVFQAGKGFIYYNSSSEPISLNWGDYYMPQETITMAARPTQWNYQANNYAQSMPVVATLNGVADLERYSIGAFVGDECRGHGEAVDGEHFFISVAGASGEQVCFKLYDATTDTYSDIETALNFAEKAGSLRKPVTLVTPSTAIVSPRSESTLALCYQNCHILVNGAPDQLLVSVKNMAGYTVLTSHSANTSVEHLPAGTYIVTASDGKCVKTIKMTK
jgi:hypothetical protein